MKFTSILLSAGAASALALPQPQVGAAPAEGKLIPTGSSELATIAKLTGKDGLLDAGLRPLVRNEIVDSTPCGSVSLIFARASSEPSNMGASMGPWICGGLKKKYGEKEVLCQGVGSPGYTASIPGNLQGKGTTASAITEATKMFTRAHTKCPDAVIVFGGYSQGTAVMHNTVGKLSAEVKKTIAGGVLYGDTRNKQDKGAITGYPADQVKIFCDPQDGVCFGSLSVTNGHFVYTMNGDGKKGVDYLVGKIDKYFG